jgi:hypothetical protein
LQNVEPLGQSLKCLESAEYVWVFTPHMIGPSRSIFGKAAVWLMVHTSHCTIGAHLSSLAVACRVRVLGRGAIADFMKEKCKAGTQV